MRAASVLVLLLACSHASAPPATSGSAGSASAPETTVINAEALAREVVAKLGAHDFAAVLARFDERMSSGLPLDRLQSTWLKLEESAGAFDHIESVSVRDKDGVHVVLVTTHFAHAPLVLQVNVDDFGHVIGLLIRPNDHPTVWQAPPYARVDAIENQPVTVGTKPALPGTLTLPLGTGPFPAIVLVHGSGPNDADESIGAIKVFKDLAFGLASKGVAVLRYEKRTHADPTGVRTQKDEVDDAAHAAVALLKANPAIDPKRIVLLGHSQGGYLAPRIARADPAIRALVIFAGPTRTLEDSLMAQLAYLVSLEPGDSKRKVLLEDAERFKLAVENPDLKADDVLNFPLGGPLTGVYFLDVRGYQPATVAAALAIPIAVMQGERDYQVTMKEDFAGWKAALGTRKNVAFFTYPAGNHAFVAGTGTLTPAEYAIPGHVDAKVIDDLAAWILALPR